MKSFIQLYTKIDQTTNTDVKVDALVDYFKESNDADKLWTIAIFSHRRPKRTVTTSLLRQWAVEISNLPNWLFEESYRIVGDLAETISLVLPIQIAVVDHSLTYWINYIKSLEGLKEAEKKDRVIAAWECLDKEGRFVFNKLITGGFRIGVSQRLMVMALAKYTCLEENALSRRLIGNWSPDTTTFRDLIFSKSALDDISKPYPFCVADSLEVDLSELGNPSDWQVERIWDGIRGQIIIRDKELFVWSKEEELVTDKYPEYLSFIHALPNGTVIDGEILAFKDGRPLSFMELQTRSRRKKVTKKQLQEAPVVLVAYDLLEWEGKDIREESLSFRRAKLEQLVKESNTNGLLLFSDEIPFVKWTDLVKERTNSRQYRCKGLMIKKKDSIYNSGQTKVDWWKWKVDPMVIDAILIYAQRGERGQTNLYNDFTFAVWENDKLVPFTKAYTGLTDQELETITIFIKKNTIERFGPVRSVKPELVFEVAFEGIQESKRHKSGLALRNPRISRWRTDKKASEASTLKDLKDLLQLYALK